MTPPYHLSEDPFKQLKDRIRLRLKEDGLDEKIVELMQEATTQLLQRENIILSRTEQSRLLQAVFKETFNEILTKL
jgi:hypothetical protein